MENPTSGSSQNGDASEEEITEPSQKGKQRLTYIGIGIAFTVLLALLVGGTFFLLQPGTPTSTIRDIVIIALGIELLFLGASIAILTLQLARLASMLQNEIHPVLEAANETISTLRGTATFLSANIVKPVVKVNGYIAAARKMFALLNFRK